MQAKAYSVWEIAPYSRILGAVGAPKTCWYCDRPLAFTKRLARANFCSDEHEDLYLAKQATLALNRVMGFASENGSAATASGSKSPESKKLDPKSPEPRSLDPKNVDPRSLDPKNADPRSLDATVARAEVHASDAAAPPDLNALAEIRITPQEQPAIKPAGDPANANAPVQPPVRTAELEPAASLESTPPALPPSSILAGDEYPSEKLREPVSIERTILPAPQPAAPQPAALQEVPLQEAVPQRLEPKKVLPPEPVKVFSSVQPAVARDDAETARRENTAPVPAHRSGTNAASMMSSSTDADAPPFLKNVLPQLRNTPRPLQTPRSGNAQPDAPRPIAEDLAPAEWADGTGVPAYPERASVAIPERVLSQCCYEPLRPIASRGASLPQPEWEESSSLRPVLPASPLELLPEIAEYPDAPLAEPTLAPAIDLDGLGLQGTRVAGKIPVQSAADSDASTARVNAADFPLPQPSLPRPVLTALGTVATGDALGTIAEDAMRPPTGTLKPDTVEDMPVEIPSASEPPPTRVAQDPPSAGALAGWADEPRDFISPPIVARAEFAPTPFIPTTMCLGRPLSGVALALALPCDAANSLKPREPVSETTLKTAVLQGGAIDVLQRGSSEPSKAKPRTPACVDAKPSLPILPGAGAKPVEPGTRLGTFDARQSCHTPRAYARGISPPQIALDLAARVKAQAVTPYAQLPAPHRGVLEACATVPARISARACYLPEFQSFSAIHSSPTRATVLLEYRPAVLKAGTPAVAFPQNNRVRSSPASLFGLPRGFGQIHVPSPAPDKVFKPAVLRTFVGPGSLVETSTVSGPSLAWMFHWEGTVAAAALPKRPAIGLRTQTRAGVRTKPAATPPQRIETIRAAIDISLGARHPGSVRPADRLRPLLPGDHVGFVAPAEPHLLRTRVRPSAWIALPPVPAHVLGSAPGHPFDPLAVDPLPEALPEAHERREESPQGEPRRFADAGSARLRQGSSLLDPAAGPAAEELHLVCHDPINLLILKEQEYSLHWPAPESLAADRGPTLPETLPVGAGAAHLDIFETIQLGIAMKKSRY